MKENKHIEYPSNNLQTSGSQEVLLRLDDLLGNITILLEKMRKTGSHVDKIKNNDYFHS